MAESVESGHIGRIVIRGISPASQSRETALVGTYRRLIIPFASPPAIQLRFQFKDIFHIRFQLGPLRIRRNMPSVRTNPLRTGMYRRIPVIQTSI